MSDLLTRKRLLAWRSIAIGAMAGAFMLAASAAAETYVLKIGFTPINDPFHAFAEEFAEELEARSDGRIDVQVFPAGQLGTAPRQIEALQFGTQEMFISPPGFFAGIHPGFQVLDAPGLIRDMPHGHAVVTDSEFQDAFFELALPAGIRVGAIWAYEPSSIAAIQPLDGIEGLRGLRTRVLASPIEQELASALGMTGISMDFTEVLPALQTGTVDAVRTSLVVMGGMGFYDTVTHALKEQTGMIWGGAFLSEAWLDQLPDDLRELVLETLRDMNDRATEISIEFSEREEARWEDAGVVIVELSDDERQELFESVSDIGPSLMADDPQAGEVWQAFENALERADAQ